MDNGSKDINPFYPRDPACWEAGGVGAELATVRIRDGPGKQTYSTVNGDCYHVSHGMIRTPSAAAVRACAARWHRRSRSLGARDHCCPACIPFRRRDARGLAGDGRTMPKKQTTAGKKARAAAREGEKYTTALRRQLPPTGSEHPVRLEHRSLLDHPTGFRPFRGTDLFERIGGQPAGG